MKKTSTLLAAFFSAFLFCCNGFGQPTIAWTARYNGPVNKADEVRAMVVDANGNVYVTGPSDGAKKGNLDYATIKYNAFGQQKWVARYNGTGNDEDWPYAIAVDGTGNVYVAGRSIGTGGSFDYATVKYDSNGVQLWVARYDGPAHGADIANSVQVDVAGNVYVTGYADGSGALLAPGNAVVTIMYNASGQQQWVARYDALANGNKEEGNSIALDAGGNVYVAGISAGYLIVKYNGAGQQQWIRHADGQYARKILIDASNNVLVTGWGSKTIKYDSAGTMIWQAVYAGNASFQDMVLDASGNAYVTGDATESGTKEDFTTVKYDANGAQQWKARFNGSNNGIDLPRSIALDGSGNIYVTGRCEINNGSKNGGVNYGTVKYNNSGIQQWVALYDSPDKLGASDAFAIAADAAGNVYVSGQSATRSTDYDFATIKYAQGSNLNSMATVLANKPAANFALYNYPNPFYQTTIIKYQLPKEGKVKLTVYDLSGSKIALLIDQSQAAGTHAVNFKADKLLPGTYYYRIESGEYSETKKLILVK